MKNLNNLWLELGEIEYINHVSKIEIGLITNNTNIKYQKNDSIDVRWKRMNQLTQLILAQ